MPPSTTSVTPSSGAQTRSEDVIWHYWEFWLGLAVLSVIPIHLVFRWRAESQRRPDCVFDVANRYESVPREDWKAVLESDHSPENPATTWSSTE